MILVDTSVWIDHLRRGDPTLALLLNTGLILTHPFVIGEIALGNLRQRDTILSALHDLPVCDSATDGEVLHFIATHKLHGSGIGYIDAHLLAAARIASAKLWTRDKRLQSAAQKLKLAYASSA